MLFPAIMAFSAIGIYSVNTSSFEIYLTALFGIVGFVCMRLGFPLAPMLLGFVLGPMMEENLRRAMLQSGGDPSGFVQRPVSAAVFTTPTGVLLLGWCWRAGRRRPPKRGGWFPKPPRRHPGPRGRPPGRPECRLLCRASTSLECRPHKDVDGRDKPGHDDLPI